MFSLSKIDKSDTLIKKFAFLWIVKDVFVKKN